MKQYLRDNLKSHLIALAIALILFCLFGRAHAEESKSTTIVVKMKDGQTYLLEIKPLKLHKNPQIDQGKDNHHMYATMGFSDKSVYIDYNGQTIMVGDHTDQDTGIGYRYSKDSGEVGIHILPARKYTIKINWRF